MSVGLTGAVFAEAGYLTLGGGLQAASGIQGLGGLGSKQAAFGFARSFGLGSSLSLFSHRKQISKASDWSAYMLIRGYVLASSIQTGINTKFNRALWEKKHGAITGMAVDDYVLFNHSPRYTPNAMAGAFYAGMIRRSLEKFDVEKNRFYG